MFAEFGVRMAAVCSGGAGFDPGNGSAASFSELLDCVPRSCRFVVPVVCGNDWYDGFLFEEAAERCALRSGSHSITRHVQACMELLQ